MRKFYIIIISCLLLISTSVTAADKQFTIILDWFVNPNHAPILVAQSQGIFKKYGLKVNIVSPADPTDPPKWVAMNKADLAIDYQPHVILEVAKGLPIKQVGTLVDHPLNCLVVLASSPVTKLSALRKQTLAYSSPQIDLVILKTMLAHEGIPLKDVHPINVHYNLTQALLTQKTAAAIGMMRNVELTQLKLLGKPGRAFYPEDYGVPAYSELVFIAKNTTQDERYQRFFRALNEAKVYLQGHPQESFQQVLKGYPELNNPLNKVVWADTIKEFTNDFSGVDWLQYRKVQAFILGHGDVISSESISHP
jgi:putative hydroxymethylpyrimidine transport system substrate-binding protein